jgi:hypothetical protein
VTSPASSPTPPTPAPARLADRRPLDKPARALAITLLAETREELNRADNKASILLATSGIGISAMLAAVFAGSWHPLSLAVPYRSIWLVGAAFAGGGIVSLCAAVYPRVKNTNSTSASYFGDIATKTVDELRTALNATAENGEERTLNQLHVLSRIVARKYRLIRVGLLSFGTAAALCVFAALAGHYVG